MSYLIKRLFKNKSTRVLVYFYLLIIVLGVFFEFSSYFQQKRFLSQATYARLQPIAKFAASEIDAYRLKNLLNNNVQKDDLTHVKQNDNYFKIHAALKRVYELEEVKSPIYILIYDEQRDVFRYVVRSDDQMYYLHKYHEYPGSLLELYKNGQGGSLPIYESENGEWLSAVEPILDGQGNVIAIVEVDENARLYFEEVRKHFVQEFIYIFTGILAIALILIPVVRKILIDEKKRLDEITHQRDTIEEFSNEVQASVRYASALQKALVRPLESNEVVQNVFIVNKPRDIVSGDFRWYADSDEYYYIAVADCTGHGVPGAMLSVIGSTILNMLLKQENNPTPGKLLESFDELFSAYINMKSEGLRRDGMDIGVVRVCKKNSEIIFAGGYNDLFYKTNNEIVRIKGNRYPVGGGEDYVKKGFTDHEIKIEGKKQFFLFSDGFQDQFGGHEGKKLGKKGWLNILNNTSEIPLKKRSKYVDNSMMKWQGDNFQVDDMLLVSFEINV